MKDWYIEGEAYGNCNCAWGCPCQFEADPTWGDCRGFEVVRIDKGHFDGLDLSGLKTALFYSWPGLISEGKGHYQAVIDENANAEQRIALESILHGKETEEAATYWWVFHSMCDTIHPTLHRPIEVEMNVAKVTARVHIPGVVESTGGPIRADHSDGAVHRAQIVLADGMEYEVAEMGSASSKSGEDCAVDLNLTDSYGQWNALKISGKGLVRT